MTSKRFLSDKKTSYQTISISPALREWIKRYVNVMHKKNPDDKCYKSVSAFYCYVMEKLLTIFEEGKTLNDIDKAADKKVLDIYDKFTFKAIIPFYNIGILNNKYSDKNVKFSPSMFLKFREWVLKDVDPRDFNSIKKIMQRLKKFLISNRLTKELRVELLKEKERKYFKAIIEYIGIYKNLHYENCKAMAGILGFLGARLEDFLFSETDLYARFDFRETNLWTEQEFVKKERMKLIDYNLKYLLNYNNIINDKEFYLWMKMAEDKDIYLKFSNERNLEKWFNIIISDFQNFGLKDDFLLNILRFFEKLHWIIIENEGYLSFRLNIPQEKEERYNKEVKLISKIIEPYAEIKKKGDLYFLEKW